VRACGAGARLREGGGAMGMGRAAPRLGVGGMREPGRVGLGRLGFGGGWARVWALGRDREVRWL